jgi:hypothetical protein
VAATTNNRVVIMENTSTHEAERMTFARLSCNSKLTRKEIESVLIKVR